MNKKIICSIAAGIVIAALPTFAQISSNELAALNKRIEALENGAEKSDWTDKVQVKGDVRYRYELKKKDSATDKSRHRIRARVGAYGKMADNVSAGIRIASGSDDSPTSTNQDINDFGNKKSIWLDLAYVTLNCEKVDGLSATFGKMKQPWESVSDLIFDGDFNPEGISFAYETEFESISIMSQLGYHIMAEDKWDDITLFSGQIAASAKVEEDIKLTAGVGAFIYGNIEGNEVPVFGGKLAGKGNTTFNGGTNYLYGVEIVDAFAKLDIKKGPAPLKVYGEYLQNLADSVSKDSAWIFGIGTKVKDMSLDYNYRDMDADSVLGALADGDFGGPGGKGHKIKATYPLAKNTSVGATYFRINDANDVDVDLLQIDLAVKF